MKPDLNQQLDSAQQHCHQGDFHRAYPIFKRFFDRIPFGVEGKHAGLVNYFVRCLAAIGRQAEMRFYLHAIESSARSQSSVHAQYISGVLYGMKDPADLKTALSIFENVLRANPDLLTKARTKIWTAVIYERLHNDYGACRRIIDSIEPASDWFVEAGVEFWKGLLMREEGNLIGAETTFNELLLKMQSPHHYDWYYEVSIKISLIGLYLQQKERQKAIHCYHKLRKEIASRGGTLLKSQVESMEKKIRGLESLSETQIIVRKNIVHFQFGSLLREVPLASHSNIYRLLELFGNSNTQTKQQIVQSLYGRSYQSKRDDKLVYYHIHALRKFLETHGIAEQTISKNGDGYRLQPKVSMGECQL